MKVSKKAKDILLLSPWNDFLENPRAMWRHGLLLLGTILKNKGHNVTLRHLQNFVELKKIAERPFDFIGISSTTREYPYAVQIQGYFKGLDHPAKIAIGGPHVTALPNEAKRDCFDLIVVGEADLVIDKIVDYSLDRPEIVKPRLPQEQDLNDLPIPDRTLLYDEDIWRPVLYYGQKPNLKITSIMLSRGCPYKCSFCGPHFKYRRISDRKIYEELEKLYKQDFNGLIILDDLPFINEQQVKSFCEIMTKFDFEFRCNFRSDLLTEPIVKMLVKAGCRRIQLGVESANQAVLDNVNKRMTVTDSGRAVRICQCHGLQVKAMFMWGLPGDNLESAEKMVDWIKRYRPDAIQLSRFVPLPGSPLWADSHYDRYQISYYTTKSFFERSLSAQELDSLYEWILSECQKSTYIDTGVPQVQMKEASVK